MFARVAVKCSFCYEGLRLRMSGFGCLNNLLQPGCYDAGLQSTQVVLYICFEDGLGVKVILRKHCNLMFIIIIIN